MAYADIAALAKDLDFILRVSAAVAVETLYHPGHTDPYAWALAHAWDMAAQPGFGDAYAFAVAGGNPRPGNDPAVITDAMILSALQSLLPAVDPAADDPDPTPDPPPAGDPPS